MEEMSQRVSQSQVHTTDKVLFRIFMIVVGFLYFFTKLTVIFKYILYSTVADIRHRRSSCINIDPAKHQKKVNNIGIL